MWLCLCVWLCACFRRLTRVPLGLQLHWVSTIKEHLGDIMAVIRVQAAFRTFKARTYRMRPPNGCGTATRT